MEVIMKDAHSAYSWTDSNRYLIYKTWDDEIRAAKAHGLRLLKHDEVTGHFRKYYTASPEGFRRWNGPVGRAAKEYRYPIYTPKRHGDAASMAVGRNK
jgi:hypothetical protein